jgi:energy-coupling factor transport system permease protein
MYVMVARASPALRLCIAGGVAVLSVACLPPRLWRGQLSRLALICGAIAVFTALGADSVPPLLQARHPPGALEGLDATLAPETRYAYVIANLGIVTITRRSINLAITAAALTFCALQGASLCLVTTPGEEMALGLARWLRPLRPLGVPVARIALTLLLSLRFMSLVFEEVRNLCLGLAARGVDWRAQGGRGSLEVLGRLVVRLFGNLFARSDKISQAMVVRGFMGPERHRPYLMRANDTSMAANVAALGLLLVLCAAVVQLR